MTPAAANQALQIGVQHHQSGRLMEAEKIYRQILASHPNHIATLEMLALLAGQSGQPEAALELAQRVARLRPESSAAHNNLGVALWDNGRLDEALFHYAKAVAINPDLAVAFKNMANIYMEQGRQDQALLHFRKALSMRPDAADMHSNFLYSLHFRPEFDAQMILEEHRQWAARHEKPLASQRLPHENDPDPVRRLRIGYISANFYNHPVGRFLLPLFAHHDHQQFEIICYSDETRIDAFTQTLKSRADRWHSVETPSDSDLADRIRQDRIDILVDLAQHAASNRLLAFARKPAPVQVAWLGYPGTTGLEAMDYRLTDPYLDPPGRGDEDYTERSIRLPHCFWCYEEMEQTPPVNRLPASQNGYITFGCLNRFDKVTEPTLILWRQIMQALPKSRLLIHSKIGDHLDGVRRFFEEGGIAPRRLEFVERKRGIYYIHQYHRFDICLDPFPHGGGTITCDALFMGVPVVTLSGRTVVGRGGASLLNNVGLPELIGHSTEEYLAIVLDLAKNPQRLEQLRAGLRERMKASPLMDAKRFTADIEAAYRQMWKTWCAAHPRRLMQGSSQ